MENQQFDFKDVPMPNVFMIGGPNGAGKTTCAMRLLPALLECEEYVNADSIAQGISPFKPESTAMLAGRLMLKRVRQLVDSQRSFAFESTLSSRSFEPFLRKCVEKGYQSNLIFLWLRSPDLAVARVAERVSSGGHTVPEKVVRRRYWAGLRNFLHLYVPVADNWICYDNSGKEPAAVSKGNAGGATVIEQTETWRLIMEMVK